MCNSAKDKRNLRSALTSSIIKFRFPLIFNSIHSTVSEMFYFSFSPVGNFTTFQFRIFPNKNARKHPKNFSNWTLHRKLCLGFILSSYFLNGVNVYYVT